MNFQMFKQVLKRDRRTRNQIANIRWVIKKPESSRKTSIPALLTMPKPLTVWITALINAVKIPQIMDIIGDMFSSRKYICVKNKMS